MLVEPTLAANVGAAARAIKTMGFTRLLVVKPRDADYRNDADAVARATGAADVLAASEATADLGQALSGVTFALAMTGYDREFGPQFIDLRRGAAQAAVELQAAPAGEIAFVFGTERSGLSNADIQCCQISCAIPANPEFASLNLAQSVQVAAYECQLALRGTAAIHAAQRRFHGDDPPAPVDEAAENLAMHETHEKDHGRTETRRYYQSTSLEWFADRDKWEGLRSVGMVESVREVGNNRTVERRFYLSSLSLDAATFARAVRGHLAVEDKVHWVLDVCFREDQSRARRGYAAENLATLRRLALNLLRREKTKKRGIKGKQLNAGWNHAYLLQTLGIKMRLP